MRVFSTLMFRIQTRTRVTWELMRVEKREFAWEFSQLSCPVETIEQELRESWHVKVCMRVFPILMFCPNENKSYIISELRSESLHESFLNSHVPYKREQELHESFRELNWWKSVKVGDQTRAMVATLVNSRPEYNIQYSNTVQLLYTLK